MRRVLVTAIALAAALPFLVGGQAGPAAGKGSEVSSKMARRIQRSGVVDVDPNKARASLLQRLDRASVPPPRPTGTSGCPDRGRNVRVNQECTNQSEPLYVGRGQAQNETAIAVNPRNARNLLAGQNDYSEGDGNCGVDFSLDGGRHWGHRILPTRFTTGTTAPRHYWEAGGDPSVAFDSRGVAYYLCLVFDRGATSEAGGEQSAFLLFRSLDGGASWNFSGSLVKGSREAALFLDKPYMTVDNNPRSPFRDRIYVAWTEFVSGAAGEFLGSPISFAYSDDGGASWVFDQTINVGASPELCPVQFSAQPEPNVCDANQFANPFVAPNGDVYVVHQNFNNCAGFYRTFGINCPGPIGDNHNQMLIYKSTNGGASFTGPFHVGDFYDLPDCFEYTGDDLFRSCVPTAPLSNRSVFRATNYPTGVAIGNDTIVVDYGSYINRHSNPQLGNCRPAGLKVSPPEEATFLPLYRGVGRVNGCNNDIVISVSRDGGQTWTGNDTPPSRLPSRNDEREGGPLADQFWQWSAKTHVPDTLVTTAYYDRKYDRDMRLGRNDITLALGTTRHVKVTDEVNPPAVDFPGTSGFSLFLGDYMGLAVGRDGTAYPFWTDTRNPAFGWDPDADVRDLFRLGHSGDVYAASIDLRTLGR